MAISRFNNPARYNPIQTYVPLPIDDLRYSLQLKQHNYDLNKQEEMSFLDSLHKVRAREEDTPALQMINQAYESELNNIVESVNKDYGSSDWKNRFSRVKNHLGSNMSSGDLSAIHQNYNNFQDWNKKVLDEKDNYNPYLDRAYTKIAPGFYGGYRKPDGSFNIASPSAIDKAVNREEVADSIVKGINSIGGASVKFSKDPNTGDDIIVSQSGERISPDKIRGAFRPAFANSEAMQQIQREADFNARMAQRQGREFDRDSFVQNAVNDLEDFVVSKYTMRKGDMAAKIDRMPEYRDKTQTPVYSPTANGAAFTNPNVASEISDKNLSADPEFQRFVSQESMAQGRKQRSIDELYKAYYGTDAVPTKPDDVKPQIERINKKFDTKFTKEEYIQSFNKAIKDIKNVTLPGTQIQPEQAKVYAELLNNQKASSLYNVGGRQLNINQIAEENKVNPEEITISPSLIHYDSVDPNHKGGNVEVTLGIKGKGFIPATTALNDNFTSETNVISEIGQNSIYKGTDTYTEKNPLFDPQRNSDIYTVTTPKKSYAAGKELPFETKVIIQPRNGEKPIEVTYNVFKEIYGSQAISRLQQVVNSNQTLRPKDTK